MTSDDKFYAQQGYRVKHSYKKRGSGVGTICVRCGVRRRKTSAGWEWWRPLTKSWNLNNPPCTLRDVAAIDADSTPEAARADRPTAIPALTDRVVTGDLVLEAPLRNTRIRVQAGDILQFPSTFETYALGMLWVWSRTATESLLMQALHVTRTHRVLAICWSTALAEYLRTQIDGPKTLCEVLVLREGGVLPTPRWPQKKG